VDYSAGQDLERECMGVKVLAATALIVLHGASGVVIEVNPGQITHLRRPEGQKNFTPGVECMVNLVDGKYVTVRESCEAVRALIEKELRK
jgi:hypothetical protein